MALAAAVDPKQAADELREQLLSQGPFKAVYEIAMPSRGKRTTLEIAADLPRACYLILDRGSEKEVHIYADAGRRALCILRREKDQPTLLHTDGTGLVNTANAVRTAFIKAGLGSETVLPEVTGGPGSAAKEELHLFVTVHLSPTRDARGRPYIRAGTALAIGAVPDCGDWLLDLAAAEGGALTATEETYRLTDQGRGEPEGRARPPGSEITVSRKTGLPTAARAEPTPAEATTLTLKRHERLTALEAPPWVSSPPAGTKVKDLALPAAQRNTAAYTAWTYYVGRSISHLAREADWKGTLEKQRDQIAETLAGEAAPLWQVRGIDIRRGFLAVLSGAHQEAQRRFRYVKESDPQKARAIAHQYALEAIQRRDDMLKAALEKMMAQFARDLRGDVAGSPPPSEVAVSAELLAIVHQAVRTAYVRQAAGLIADQLTTPGGEGR